MKNKKGFTLVELLAVIVILTMILAMVMPNVQDLITDSKTKLDVSTAYTIIKASKMYTIETGDFNEINVLDERLNYEGEKPTSGLVQTNIEENTRIAIMKDGWCIKKSYIENEVTYSKTNTCVLP